MLFSKKKWQLFSLIIIGILTFILLFHIREDLKNILSPLIWSIVVAYLLDPLVNFIQREKLKRSLAILIIYLIFIGIFIIIGWSIIPAIIKETKNLIGDMPYYTGQIQEFLLLIRQSGKSQLPKSINNLLENGITAVEDSIINGIKSAYFTVANFFSGILNIVIIPVIAYYLLKDKEYFIKLAVQFIPKKWRSKIIDVAKDSDKVIGGFIKGQIIVTAFVGIFTALGLYLLNINYAFTIGILTGIINIIPYFGPIIAAVPATIIAFFQGPIKVVWVIVLFFIVQQVEGDIIAPKIIGSNVGLHPVAIIFSLLIGGSFFGVVGMILAVPVAGTIRVVGKHIINYIITVNDNY